MIRGLRGRPEDVNAYQENLNLLLSDNNGALGHRSLGLDIHCQRRALHHVATVSSRRIATISLLPTWARGLSRAQAERLIVRVFLLLPGPCSDRIDLEPRCFEALVASLAGSHPACLSRTAHNNPFARPFSLIPHFLLLICRFLFLYRFLPFSCLFFLLSSLSQAHLHLSLSISSRRARRSFAAAEGCSCATRNARHRARSSTNHCKPESTVAPAGRITRPECSGTLCLARFPRRYNRLRCSARSRSGGSTCALNPASGGDRRPRCGTSRACGCAREVRVRVFSVPARVPEELRERSVHRSKNRLFCPVTFSMPTRNVRYSCLESAQRSRLSSRPRDGAAMWRTSAEVSENRRCAALYAAVAFSAASMCAPFFFSLLVCWLFYGLLDWFSLARFTMHLTAYGRGPYRMIHLAGAESSGKRSVLSRPVGPILTLWPVLAAWSAQPVAPSTGSLGRRSPQTKHDYDLLQRPHRRFALVRRSRAQVKLA